MTQRFLFILKRRPDYNDDTSYSQKGMSTGLYNSASFVSDMLVKNGVEAKIAVVIDNNCIDREVTQYKPTTVIIEALWVVPEKFAVLTKLHPKVNWVIRMHSETPFIANEGMAMKWIQEYVKYPNVSVGINAPRFLKDIKTVLAASGVSGADVKKKIVYLPNYYPVDAEQYDHYKPNDERVVNVGCFGAIRPLKNHLVQAIAALEFAQKIGRKLRFHVNIGRVEMKGEAVLNNLKALFDGVKDQGHELVINLWAPHDQFIHLVKSMDIGLQVSFSETFNIVAADMVTADIPIVVSREVPWAVCGIANPVDSTDIAKSLTHAWNWKWLNIAINKYSLRQYVKKSERTWLNYARSA